MELNELVSIAVNALEDVKAKDIKIFNTEALTDQFERVIIASGTSGRQTRALAFSVSSAVKQAGGDVLGMEGEDTGEWVLVDLGTVVVHALQPNVRDYYNLEEIWGGKEVFLEAQAECGSRLMPHRPHDPQPDAE
ncbi:ribosome silencing factor [Sutterella sp.]|uniref:ribosome silencing factor n=1 Tax=Sutterella sp. TaxID=1981025 RepID=UPI0025DDFB8D|nr:ribosome silencing factor [uncultured Sutterella sp.]